jgi:hypothetical protein
MVLAPHLAVIITSDAQGETPGLPDISLSFITCYMADHKGKISPSKYDSSKEDMENIPLITKLISKYVGVK